MAEHPVDLAAWPRAERFRFFRGYGRPHFATTARVDVTRLLTVGRAAGSPYRACLHAVGRGLHAVPEMLTRFRADRVVRHDALALSVTVPTADGGFRHACVPFVPDRAASDAAARALIEAARQGALGGEG